jgi:glucose-1-phosphate adenylyltransferase
VCAQAYLFDDYWEDIGTIKSFFDANLALTAQVIAPYNGFMNFLLFW